MAEYTERVNLRISAETYDTYRRLAALMGTPISHAIRQTLDVAVPDIEQLLLAAEEIAGGEPLVGVELMHTLMQKLQAQAEMGVQSMDVLRRRAAAAKQ